MTPSCRQLFCQPGTAAPRPWGVTGGVATYKSAARSCLIPDEPCPCQPRPVRLRHRSGCLSRRSDRGIRDLAPCKWDEDHSHCDPEREGSSKISGALGSNGAKMERLMTVRLPY